jgi:hypothetical protein
MWTSWSSLLPNLACLRHWVTADHCDRGWLTQAGASPVSRRIAQTAYLRAKVRGARDQADEFIRLADAVAGGIWGNIEGDLTQVLCCSAACLIRCRLLLRRLGVTSFAEEEQRLRGLWGNHRRETVACFEAGMHGRDYLREAPV